MMLGVTIGKFYPFHLGHDHLIRTAKSQVDHLVVLVGYRPNQQIPGSIRAQWIRKMHPDIEVIEVIEDIPDAPEPWAERTLTVLQGRKPDLVFTSETYGDAWAELIGSQHVLVDLDRKHFPISGSELRADVAKHWQMLTALSKAYLARRICVLGVESSGTTTLAMALAKHYETIWVPEYGRIYWEGKRYLHQPKLWDTREFINIAKGQAQLEDDLAGLANRLLICDTDPLATHVWHRRYLDHYSLEVEAIADARKYDLYLLTAPDFGFIQDGTREGETIRDTMHGWFIEALEKKNKPYKIVVGTQENRLRQAVEEINSIRNYAPLLSPMHDT